MYSKEELVKLRYQIENPNQEFSDDLKEFESIYTNQNINKVKPFLKLVKEDRELFEKILEDKVLQDYQWLALMPELEDLFYPEIKDIKIKVIQANRGNIIFIQSEEKTRVIKRPQSQEEIQILSKIQTFINHPEQFDSLKNWITEEYVEGTEGSLIKSSEKNDGELFLIGSSLGENLKKLHANNIVYNDTIICDDLGNSNMIVDKDNKSILIDYGVALDISTYPLFTDDQIYRYLFTEPFGGMMIMMSEDEIQGKINHFKNNIPSKKVLFDKDINFVQQGLYLLRGRQGGNTNKILEGFESSYYK